MRVHLHVKTTTAMCDSLIVIDAVLIDSEIRIAMHMITTERQARERVRRPYWNWPCPARVRQLNRTVPGRVGSAVPALVRVSRPVRLASGTRHSSYPLRSGPARVSVIATITRLSRVIAFR